MRAVITERILPFPQYFMASLVDQVHSTHANENHFKDGILHKHSCCNTGYWQEIILDVHLALAGEHTYKEIREHGQYIAKVMADFAYAVQPESG